MSAQLEAQRIIATSCIEELEAALDSERLATTQLKEEHDVALEEAHREAAYANQVVDECRAEVC